MSWQRLLETMKSVVFWVVTPCNSESPTFWKNVTPSSLVKSNPSKKPAEDGSKLIWI
jgi:hypothetical protein